MFLIILSLVFIAAGIVVWVVGSRVNRRIAGQHNKSQKKKYRRISEKLGLAAVSFIFGFILLQGARL